jgi:hypothetical protein
MSLRETYYLENENIDPPKPIPDPPKPGKGLSNYCYRLANILRDLTQFLQEITIASEKLTEADATAKADYNTAQYKEGDFHVDEKGNKTPDNSKNTWGAVALAEWYEVHASFDKDGKDALTGKTQNQLHTEFQNECTKMQQKNDQMDQGLQTIRNEVQSCGSALTQIDQNNNNILSQNNLISQLLMKN